HAFRGVSAISIRNGHRPSSTLPGAKLVEARDQLTPARNPGISLAVQRCRSNHIVVCDSLARNRTHTCAVPLNVEKLTLGGRYASNGHLTPWPGSTVDRLCCRRPYCIGQLDRDAGACPGNRRRIGRSRLPRRPRALWRLAPPPPLRRCV